MKTGYPPSRFDLAPDQRLSWKALLAGAVILAFVAIGLAVTGCSRDRDDHPNPLPTVDMEPPPPDCPPRP